MFPLVVAVADAVGRCCCCCYKFAVDYHIIECHVLFFFSCLEPLDCTTESVKIMLVRNFSLWFLVISICSCCVGLDNDLSLIQLLVPINAE